MGVGKTALRGGCLLGAIGFAGGFFGSMIFTPEANQGPMLGLFITGPLGFVFGLLFGAVIGAALDQPAHRKGQHEQQHRDRRDQVRRQSQRRAMRRKHRPRRRQNLAIGHSHILIALSAFLVGFRLIHTVGWNSTLHPIRRRPRLRPCRPFTPAPTLQCRPIARTGRPPGSASSCPACWRRAASRAPRGRRACRDRVRIACAAGSRAPRSIARGTKRFAIMPGGWPIRSQAMPRWRRPCGASMRLAVAHPRLRRSVVDAAAAHARGRHVAQVSRNCRVPVASTPRGGCGSGKNPAGPVLS